MAGQNAAPTPVAAQAAAVAAAAAPVGNGVVTDKPEEVVKDKSEKGKVVVACALPHGYTLEHEGETVTFAGANSPSAVVGYGLTPDVDADWFNDWVNGAGKTFKAVQNGAIFARASGIHDAAKERAGDVVTGFEGINGDKPGFGLEKVASES